MYLKKENIALHELIRHSHIAIDTLLVCDHFCNVGAQIIIVYCANYDILHQKS